MQHIICGKLLGWGEEKEYIPFDSSVYTKEEAMEQFVPYKAFNEGGYQYTGYEYQGKKYYRFSYLGLFEDDKVPHNEEEYWKYKLRNY